jgi:hypothetical protein
MLYLRKDATLHAPKPPAALRRSLALACLLLGLAGCLLPIIPGLPFMIAAARLLGPRDPMIRRANVAGSRGLRALRGSRVRLLRRAGAGLTPHWRTFRQLMLGTR